MTFCVNVTHTVTHLYTLLGIISVLALFYNYLIIQITFFLHVKVFEAHSDGHVTVLNSLIPPVVARYLLLKPQKWHIRSCAQVQVLGCPSAPLRTRSYGDGEGLLQNLF